MRILFLTQVLPYPLDAGPKVRAYYVLRHLAQRHLVTLVSFVRPTDTPAAIDHLRSFCHAVHTVSMVRSQIKDGGYFIRSLVTGQPFIIARDWLPTMARQLQALVGQSTPFDAVHADQLWMAPYALWVRQLTNSHPPRLTLDQHNAVYMIPRRMAETERHPVKQALLRLEAWKLFRYELATCQKFNHVVWVTREDYAAFQQQAQFKKFTIPNDAVIPICGDPEGVAPIVRQQRPNRITFLGGLHYPPNAQGVLWFAERVFPQILEHYPKAVLTVIGKQPPLALNALGLPPENVDITGYLDDPRPYLKETGVFIVPLQAGGGMRVKIIDGWTWRLPIVSTTVGAEGIDFTPGEQLFIADTPESFAQATIKLLCEPAIANRLAQAGRDWALKQYNWRAAYRQWDAIYQ